MLCDSAAVSCGPPSQIAPPWSKSDRFGLLRYKWRGGGYFELYWGIWLLTRVPSRYWVFLSLWVSQSLFIWTSGCSSIFIFLCCVISASPDPIQLGPRGSFASELKNYFAAEMADIDFKWNCFSALDCKHAICYTSNHRPTEQNVLQYNYSPSSASFLHYLFFVFDILKQN